MRAPIVSRCHLRVDGEMTSHVVKEIALDKVGVQDVEQEFDMLQKVKGIPGVVLATQKPIYRKNSGFLLTE